MPWTQQGIPWTGAEPASQHASWTGAKAAEPTRAAKTKRYVELLKRHGSLTDQQVATITGWPLSSVNSIRNGLGDLVVVEGFESQVCGSRQTKRIRWQWNG